MKLWIDTDIGANPDDTVACWCAERTPETDLVGISTVDGDVEQRAAFTKRLLPGVNVIAGPPPVAALADVDVLLCIGPWTHARDLGRANALPRRVVLMGGALGAVKHRGSIQRIEHNVGRDPEAARELLEHTGSLIVVPLDATVQVRAFERDEDVLTEEIPGFGEQLKSWRAEHGDLPLVLHDPAALLVALGEPISRMESRRLQVDPDGTMYASVDGPLQNIVAHIDAGETRSRVRTLARRDQ